MECIRKNTVFTNVSKGVAAKSKDLRKAFGSTDQETICKQILEKGESRFAGMSSKIEAREYFASEADIDKHKNHSSMIELSAATANRKS